MLTVSNMNKSIGIITYTCFGIIVIYKTFCEPLLLFETKLLLF